MKHSVIVETGETFRINEVIKQLVKSSERSHNYRFLFSLSGDTQFTEGMFSEKIIY